MSYEEHKTLTSEAENYEPRLLLHKHGCKKKLFTNLKI